MPTLEVVFAWLFIAVMVIGGTAWLVSVKRLARKQKKQQPKTDLGKQFAKKTAELKQFEQDLPSLR